MNNNVYDTYIHTHNYIDSTLYIFEKSLLIDCKPIKEPLFILFCGRWTDTVFVTKEKLLAIVMR